MGERLALVVLLVWLRSCASAPGVTNFSLSLNHHSPNRCNDEFRKWFGETYSSARSVQVLDVGGGQGALYRFVQKTTQAAIEWKCIDVAPPAGSPCEQFDGSLLPFESKSRDLVVFNYVLHHASVKNYSSPSRRSEAKQLSLLREAARVTRGYIAVAEDLRAMGKAGRFAQWKHDKNGLYRSDISWRDLFAQLGLRLAAVRSTSEHCASSQKLAVYVVARKLYILTPAQ